MLDGELEIAQKDVSVLGESPVWDHLRERLFWVDSLSRRIHLLDGSGGYRCWIAPDVIGSFALCENGLGLCALRSELRLLDLDCGRFSTFLTMPNNPRLSRLNDGKCDRQGRFWVGTMTEGEGEKQGALYRVDPSGTVTKAFDRFINSNGLAFPLSGNWFFHSDSRVGKIFKVSAQANGHYRRELFHQTDAKRERPDGAALDEEGCYWSALYGGGAVIRIDPSGREVFRLHIPTPYPTMVCFGGRDLKTLYITTATLGGMDPEVKQDQVAGRLLRANVKVAGLPEPRFGL